MRASLEKTITRRSRGEEALILSSLPDQIRLRVLQGLILCFLLASVQAGESRWKAGTAVTIITPGQPLWMAGYASRTHAAEGKYMELHLKALALEDAAGHRALIVSSDLLGMPQTIYQHCCAALKEKLALEPDQILLTASHTHCGPVLRESLLDIYDLDATQRSYIEAYSRELESKLLSTAEAAFSHLAPARLASGQGTTSFAVNRRNNVETNVLTLLEQGTTEGPVEHSVPVLIVSSPDGVLKCVLFGYACHNTVMDFYKWSGDYAGFAQLALEKSHPEAVAMFFMGCGGDQNPMPRRQPALAERYGDMLAAAVEEVLRAPRHTLAAQLETSMVMVDLQLGAAPTEAELEQFSADSDAIKRRWAVRLLAQLKTGKPFARTYPYPVQAWLFGGNQLLLTLGGEPVVDYALKLKSEFGAQTWVAGYCNDVMAYIPSRRVLKEDMPPLAQPTWGYEGARAMMVYGLPAYRWADTVQGQISASVRRLTLRVKYNMR